MPKDALGWEGAYEGSDHSSVSLQVDYHRFCRPYDVGVVVDAVDVPRMAALSAQALFRDRLNSPIKRHRSSQCQSAKHCSFSPESRSRDKKTRREHSLAVYSEPKPTACR
ncbi:uncharacterized protein SPSK_10352 [Sporothrix schenckii 1099-18]|uniref:Uncharacterized protein n=1 Tax=Sporothrix schenckii 1099-18 TaxID=1397361 RepID=A0A0F2LY55_SPOSC|nr:uncharacterized protein SPSK_10352 [Sporothrix schenckii 1099-18]KJR81774.1 hypothetical protein SPSK_10352 [Sporothrix schenckii 1099-18]